MNDPALSGGQGEPLAWKPGPPPLDKPGRFDAVFTDGEQRAIRVMGANCVAVAGDSPGLDLDLYNPSTVVSHFGPIPDPPLPPPWGPRPPGNENALTTEA